MRLVLALVVAFIVAACAIQQSSSKLGYVLSDGARSAQATLDAEAILQGMTQARNANERLARDNREYAPSTTAPAITR
jgi:hypothetical protein